MTEEASLEEEKPSDWPRGIWLTVAATFEDQGDKFSQAATASFSRLNLIQEATVTEPQPYNSKLRTSSTNTELSCILRPQPPSPTPLPHRNDARLQHGPLRPPGPGGRPLLQPSLGQRPRPRQPSPQDVRPYSPPLPQPLLLLPPPPIPPKPFTAPLTPSHNRNQGILTIRFELPFAIWCTSCRHPTLIAQGVRFNAEKSRVGSYHSTPILRFTFTHPPVPDASKSGPIPPTPHISSTAGPENGISVRQKRGRGKGMWWSRG